MQQSAHPPQIHEQSVGLDRHHLAFHQLAHLQVLEEGSGGRPLLRQHQLAGFRVYFQEGGAKGFAHQGLVVLALLQLGTGDEAAQALQLAGDTATVEAVHLHLHNLALLLQLAHLLPALAQGQGAGADRHHAVGVLLASDEHFELQALRETLLQVGDHPQPAFTFGHEARGLAADIHIDPIALHADNRAPHHFAGGAVGLVVIQGSQEGFFVEIEVVHTAGRLLRSWGGSLGLAPLAGVRTQQVGHAEALHRAHFKQLPIVCRGGGRLVGPRLRGLEGLGLRRWRRWLILADHHHLGGLAQRRHRQGPGGDGGPGPGGGRSRAGG